MHTVREMHIELNQVLQFIDSNLDRTLVPEQKDWLLNIAQSQFVSTKLPPRVIKHKDGGFEQTQEEYDELETLKRTISLPVYVSNLTTLVHPLPPDYRHRVRVDANVEYACAGNVGTIEESTTSSTVYIASVPFLDDSNLYATYTMYTYNGIVKIFDITDYSAYASGITTQDSDFTIVNLLLDVLNEQVGVDVYWENYNGTYQSKTFIFVSDTDFVNVRVTTSTTTTYYLTSDNVYNIYDITSTYLSPCRLVSSELINKMNHDSFEKTMYSSPLVTIKNNIINISIDDTFRIDSIDFTYIKEPRRIDISIEQTSEINDNFWSEIVGIAAQKAAAWFNSSNYKAIATENLLME